MRGKQGRGRSSSDVATSVALCLLASLLAIAALMSFAAVPALAAKTHHHIVSFDAGYSASIAVEEESGNVLVVDARAQAVRVFGPEGGAPSGVASPFKIEGVGKLEGGIAVDNSAASPSKGALYVSEAGSTVKKFVLNPTTEKYELKEQLSASPAFVRATNLAVDSKGNLFVGDFPNEAVVEFSPTGAQLARIDLSASIEAPASLAVDSAGDLFLIGAGGAVYRFDANGAGEIEAGTEPVQLVRKKVGEGLGARALAVDLGADDLYVGMGNLELVNTQVDQYDASCAPEGEGSEEHCVREGEFGLGAFRDVRSLAVNSATGRLYVADTTESIFGDKPHVAVFGPTVIVPGALTAAASDVTGTTVTLNGSVDPSGSEVDECKFEWGMTTAYGKIAPCAESPAQIGAGNAPVPVHVDLSGLGLGNEYHFRLVATSDTTVPNEKGPSVGADASFTTLGPRVRAQSFSGTTDTAVRLEGAVNPAGQDTTYVFQYVSEADFAADGYAKATSAPLGGEAIGGGTDDVKVAQGISGLAPATAYRFRIAATNASGTAFGPDVTFATYAAPPAFGECPNEALRQGLGSTFLPDCRAYEQATPVDKGGAGAQGVVDYVRAANTGGGITFFSNGGIPGGEGAQQFPQYLSSRNADGGGWSTQGVLPPASNGSSAMVRGFSEDLSQAYVTQGKLPTQPQTFYQRDSVSRALRAIAGGVAPSEIHNSYAGESADGSKVLVALVYGSTPPPGAVKGQNAFVWDKSTETLHLAGVLNSGQAPAQGASPGSYDVGGPANYTSYERAISADGSRVFFSSMGSHQIYVRQNPTEPQSPLLAGKCTDPELACTVQVSASKRTIAPLKDEKPATLWFATADGSQAFFTSTGKLTDDATAGADGSDLYRYDAATGKLADLTPDPVDPNGADVQGVLGISENGSHVYFAANGVLAANQGADGSQATLGDCINKQTGGQAELIQYTVGDCNLYLWHEGTITYIASQRATGPSNGAQELKSAAWNWVRKPALEPGEKTARVSADGETLLFQSPDKLSAYDNKGLPELYRYRAETASLICVSCNPTGAAPVGPASLRSISVVISSPIRPAPVQTRNLSVDGERVFFETADKLVAGDTNGVKDVYEWEAKGSGSCAGDAENGGCLYLISTGASPDPSYFADASADGEDAFFFTLQPLVGQDKDQLVDIYDARAGGGIAAQNPPPEPEPCPGETSCRGAVPAPPATQSPGSSGFSGPGNQKPPQGKKKQKKKKKSQHKKKRQKKRQAAGKRGAGRR